MKRENWPVTAESGPAPAGKPGECFYCKVPVGGEHAADCVLRKRTVVCRVSVVYVREVPEDWDARMIDFQMNDSSSCANNLLVEVDALRKRLDATGQCLCSFVSSQYLREASEDDEEHSMWPPPGPGSIPATDGPNPGACAMDRPDWPLDDVPAWRDRAAARLRARPDLLGGLVDMTFIPAVVDKAEGYFGYSMASAGSPPIEDMTAAWICLNARRSLATALEIARVVFDIPATDGPNPGA